jgi:hypothetical protein
VGFLSTSSGLESTLPLSELVPFLVQEIQLLLWLVHKELFIFFLFPFFHLGLQVDDSFEK